MEPIPRGFGEQIEPAPGNIGAWCLLTLSSVGKPDVVSVELSSFFFFLTWLKFHVTHLEMLFLAT